MKSLTLTIIIPVYNEESYLKACLDAISSQTVKPDEVIVVDNNSTDKSAEIARSYPFVTLVHEKRQGIVYARNRGFDTASSDILSRIDADTHLDSSWVETVKLAAAELDENYAVTGPCRFYGTRVPNLTYMFHRPIYFWLSHLTFGHRILYGSNMFFFRSFWQTIKDEACVNNDIHEDMDLAAHIVRSGGQVLFDKNLKASASARRFKNWRYYPTKWARTWMIHGLIPVHYQAIREIYESGEE